jgi:hypothetical protein
MRKSPLLVALLLAGCVASWPPASHAQVKPQQGGTGAINAATDDAALIGNGTAFVPKVIPDCDDQDGQHLNWDATANAWSCGTTGSGAGVSEVTVEAPLELGGGESTPAIGVIDNGIGADKVAEDAIGTSELDDGADTPAAGECVKVASDTGKVKYEICTIGQMVVLHVFIKGKPGEDELIWGFHVPIAITCSEDFAGSYFYRWGDDPATAEKTFQVGQDGITVGEVVFEAAGGRNGVGDAAAELLNWGAGDRFSVISEGPVDATLEDVELTFVCTRAS